MDISLYVVLNSKSALYSMMAWAYDSDGEGYEVPVYYSDVGRDGLFYTLPEASVYAGRVVGGALLLSASWRLVCTLPITKTSCRCH